MSTAQRGSTTLAHNEARRMKASTQVILSAIGLAAALAAVLTLAHTASAAALGATTRYTGRAPPFSPGPPFSLGAWSRGPGRCLTPATREATKVLVAAAAFTAMAPVAQALSAGA